MNPQTESCEKPHPCDCEPGDWVAAVAVPDWAEDEERHAYVLPGQVMVQPLQQLPAAVPVVSWQFRRVSRPCGGLLRPAWIRET
jgi:hypothetical protein